MIRAFTTLQERKDLLPVGFKQNKECMTYSISASDVPADAHLVEVEFAFMSVPFGHEGYYVVPTSNTCFLTRFRAREDAVFRSNRVIMPILGYKDKKVAYLICVDGMRYSYSIQIQVKGGKYHLSIIYDLEETDLYEDIVLNIYPIAGVDADYNSIAKKYRQIQVEKNHLQPLFERVKTSEIISYAMKGMPVIRVRMGWKPVPTPVMEQTEENEPPMHIACTFVQVEEIMERLHAKGLERAEFCLVGWNYRGHDGRWPQMLPVEPALGGEAGLKQLIAHAKQLGYRVVLHTNSSDAYSVADVWDENDMIRKKNGEVSINDVTWSGGRMYHLCPKCAEEKYLPDVLKTTKAFETNGFSYIDVLTIVPLRQCFHPEHALNAEESKKHICNILRSVQSVSGGIASEGGYDFAAGSLDYALYIGFNILDGMPELCDEVIPLWQLVYHGYILSNPSAETINYCIKEPRNRLRFYEYGGFPTVYVYSKFVSTKGRLSWMGLKDVVIDDEAALNESVESIISMMEEYQPFVERQFATMDRHEKLAENVYQTSYSDGYTVICNYSDDPFTIEGHTVPAKDMIQFKIKKLSQCGK